MSVSLREKPELKWGQVWCVKCNEPANFEYTAVHRGFTKRGYLLVNVNHHGENEGLNIEFDSMDANPDRRIDCFVDPALPAPQEDQKRLLPPKSPSDVVIDV